MSGDSTDDDITSYRISRLTPPRRTRHVFFICLLLPFLFATPGTAQIQSLKPIDPASALPDAPATQIEYFSSGQQPCRVISRTQSAGAVLVSTAGRLTVQVAGFAPADSDNQAPQPARAEPPSCPPSIINPLSRFISEPHATPLTPRQKGELAIRNLLDPFNAITILGTAAVSIGSDSHTAYGPGLKGFAKNVGVAYTEDIQGEFFGTFLIPSIAHQDPRYYRMPRASIPRRVLNSIVSVYWSRSDSGKGMPNYATFIGFAINSEIINLYVPGIETDLSATTQRYIIGLAAAPIDNFITEFLPDVASKIHVRVVLVQRVINQVAKTEPVGMP